MNKEAISDTSPSPRDLIFSCVICQTTLSQACERGNIRSSPPTGSYNSADQSFWLLECAHVTCNKHLDTEATCPLCSCERNDTRPKTLYAISGFQNGQYDKDIPKVWFDIPPLKLDSSEPGMEALRFQYLSLIRYGMMTGRRLRKLEKSEGILLNTSSSLKRECDSFRKEILYLKDRISELENYEKELMRWRAKEKMIVRHLKAVKNVVKENNYLRLQLSYLGYEAPRMDYFLEGDQGNEVMPEPGERPIESSGRKSNHVKDKASMHVLQKSDANSKRKFSEFQESIGNGPKSRRRHSSRDLMPPPTSDDSLGRFGIVSNDNQYVCPQILEENPDNFQIGNDHFKYKNSGSHDAPRSISLPGLAGIEKKDPQSIRGSNFLHAPVTNRKDYVLPIERYRYRIDKQSTKTGPLYPAGQEKQLEPYGPIPLGCRSLSFRACQTPDKNEMGSTSTSRPFNGLLNDESGRSRSGKTILSTANPIHRYSAYEDAPAASLSGVHIGRQHSEHQKVPRYRYPIRESVNSFEQAEGVPRIYQEPKCRRNFSVASPFFERKSKVSQTPYLYRPQHSHQALKHSCFETNSHIQDYHHNKEFDAQLRDRLYKPAYDSGERARLERYSSHEIGMERERRSPNVLSPSKKDILFSQYRSPSIALFPNPAAAAASSSRTVTTKSSAFPNWMNTRSVSSPVRPFLASQRNNFAQRQYSSLQPNASPSPSRYQLLSKDGWPNTSYSGRRSVRR